MLRPEHGEATPMEQETINAMATGIWAGVPADGSPAHLPRNAEEFWAHRTVRAEVLADLLTGMTEEPPKAIRLFGARIAGPPKLQGAKLVCPASFMGCQFTDPVDLLDATVPFLDLMHCQLPEIVLMRAYRPVYEA